MNNEINSQSESQQAAGKTDTELDELLDQIDDVLYENADAFVSGFVQKGGQ